MCRDEIKIFAKNDKNTADLDTNHKNIQPEYRNWIWEWKMYHTYMKNWE